MIKEILVSIAFCLQCPVNTMNDIHDLIDKFNKKWDITPPPPPARTATPRPLKETGLMKIRRQKLFTIGEGKSE